ncbi:hypothetical protein VNO77_03257 [Canavalia gladiata]|uniref:Uncharacterized protein n=1 Tax=Canavalia gladiata TaxID=3824 RepID=A0AAN9MUE6_CANGL
MVIGMRLLQALGSEVNANPTGGDQDLVIKGLAGDIDSVCLKIVSLSLYGMNIDDLSLLIAKFHFNMHKRWGPRDSFACSNDHRQSDSVDEHSIFPVPPLHECKNID